VTVEFQRGDNLVGPVPARWSARPEPIRTLPVAVNGEVQLVPAPAPELVPDSYVYDLPAGGRWEEVAVAVLRDGMSAEGRTALRRRAQPRRRCLLRDRTIAIEQEITEFVQSAPAKSLRPCGFHLSHGLANHADLITATDLTHRRRVCGDE
jgi:hypothetical protein